MSDEEKKAIDMLRNYDNEDNLHKIHQSINIVLNLIEKQSKEIEEYKDIVETLRKENVSLYIERRQNENKIKAKIEEYKKLINECPMNDEEIFCKECTEKCGFNQTIDVLQSLLKEE